MFSIYTPELSTFDFIWRPFCSYMPYLHKISISYWIFYKRINISIDQWTHCNLYPLLCTCPSLRRQIKTRTPFRRRHFQMHFLEENARILLKMSLKFVPNVRIYNMPALAQRMAWHRPGDKPFSESRMESLLTQLRVTRLQWVNLYHAIHLCNSIIAGLLLNLDCSGND